MPIMSSHPLAHAHALAFALVLALVLACVLELAMLFAGYPHKVGIQFSK